VIIEPYSQRILATCFGQGHEQDFALYKRSRVKLPQHVYCRCDLGYYGMERYHKQSILPIKRAKGSALSAAEKAYNRRNAKQRVVIEHVFAALKRFKIIAERYRNRIERFAIIFNLIAAIHNFEH
jgi:hypothetical protein